MTICRARWSIDQQVEKHLKATGQWGEAQKTIDAYFAGKERPQYLGELPEGNDGLGLGLLGTRIWRGWSGLMLRAC